MLMVYNGLKSELNILAKFVFIYEKEISQMKKCSDFKGYNLACTIELRKWRQKSTIRTEFLVKLNVYFPSSFTLSISSVLEYFNFFWSSSQKKLVIRFISKLIAGCEHNN